MSIDALDEIKKMYSKILSDAHISLRGVDDLYPELILILDKIIEYFPHNKIKYIDHKFGIFRLSFFDDIEIPDELRALEKVGFYT
jgi:hypothetical protein